MARNSFKSFHHSIVFFGLLINLFFSAVWAEDEEVQNPPTDGVLDSSAMLDEPLAVSLPSKTVAWRSDYKSELVGAFGLRKDNSKLKNALNERLKEISESQKLDLDHNIITEGFSYPFEALGSLDESDLNKIVAYASKQRQNNKTIGYAWLILIKSLRNIKITPETKAHISLELAKIYHRLGYTEYALWILNNPELTKTTPINTWLGVKHLSLGDHGSCIKHLSNVVSSSSKDQNYYKAKASLALANVDYTDDVHKTRSDWHREVSKIAYDIPDPHQKARVYLALGKTKLVDEDSRGSSFFYLTALTILETHPHPKMQATTYYELGKGSVKAEEFDSQKTYFEKAIDIAKKNKLYELEAKSCLELGDAIFKIKKSQLRTSGYQKNINNKRQQLYQQCLEIATAHGYSHLRGVAMLKLAEVGFINSEHISRTAWIEEAKGIAEKEKDDLLLALTYLQKASTLNPQDSIKAPPSDQVRLYEEAKNLGEKLNNARVLGLAYLGLGNCLKSEDKIDNRNYFMKAEEQGKKCGDYSLQIRAILAIGHLEYGAMTSEGITQFKKAKKLVKETGDGYLRLRVYMAIANHYQALKKNENALTYFEKVTRFSFRNSQIFGEASKGISTVSKYLPGAGPSRRHEDRRSRSVIRDDRRDGPRNSNSSRAKGSPKPPSSFGSKRGHSSARGDAKRSKHKGA